MSRPERPGSAPHTTPVSTEECSQTAVAPGLMCHCADPTSHSSPHLREQQISHDHRRYHHPPDQICSSLPERSLSRDGVAGRINVRQLVAGYTPLKGAAQPRTGTLVWGNISCHASPLPPNPRMVRLFRRFMIKPRPVARAASGPAISQVSSSGLQLGSQALCRRRKEHCGALAVGPSRRNFKGPQATAPTLIENAWI